MFEVTVPAAWVLVTAPPGWQTATFSSSHASWLVGGQFSWVFSHKGANLVMGVPPSQPHVTLISPKGTTSNQHHKGVGVGIQHRNFGRDTVQT